MPHERGPPGGDEDTGWKRNGRGRMTVLAFCMTPPWGAPVARSRMVNGSEREKHAKAIMTVWKRQADCGGDQRTKIKAKLQTRRYGQKQLCCQGLNSELTDYMIIALLRQWHFLFSALQMNLRSAYKLGSPITDCFSIFFGHLAAHSIVPDISKILSVDQPAMIFRIQPWLWRTGLQCRRSYRHLFFAHIH
jgi:hypothetical protein